MVGVRGSGSKSQLARVCIVNAYGNVLIDKFVKPVEKVGRVDHLVRNTSAFPAAGTFRSVAGLLSGGVQGCQIWCYRNTAVIVTACGSPMSACM